MSYADYATDSLRVGYTAPSIIWDEMRRVDASVRNLDRYMVYVARQDVKDAWKVWAASWDDFYRKKSAGLGGIWAPAAALFHSDELRDQVNQYAADLERWYATYEGQETAQGEDVPPIPGAGPPSPIDKSESTAGPSLFTFRIPWWGWVAIATGGAAVAYSVYRAAEGAREDARGIAQLFATGSSAPFTHMGMRDVAPFPAPSGAPVTVNVQAPQVPESV